MMSSAVKMEIDADGETDSFDSVENAVDWCEQA